METSNYDSIKDLRTPPYHISILDDRGYNNKGISKKQPNGTHAKCRERIKERLRFYSTFAGSIY